MVLSALKAYWNDKITPKRKGDRAKVRQTWLCGARTISTSTFSHVKLILPVESSVRLGAVRIHLALFIVGVGSVMGANRNSLAVLGRI